MSDSDDATEADDFLKSIEPAHKPWENFEAEVAEHVRKQINYLRIGLNPQTAKVRTKPSYRSFHRGSDIVFDVSIEVWPVAEATKPTLLWIWECKDYPTRRVTVDEVEEFHSKLGQVGAHKGTIATRTGFASGAISFANSNGIALLTLNQEDVTHFCFSADAQARRITVCRPDFCVTSGGTVESYDDLEDYMEAELSATGMMTGW